MNVHNMRSPYIEGGTWHIISPMETILNYRKFLNQKKVENIHFCSERVAPGMLSVESLVSYHFFNFLGAHERTSKRTSTPCYLRFLCCSSALRSHDMLHTMRKRFASSRAFRQTPMITMMVSSWINGGGASVCQIFCYIFGSPWPSTTITTLFSSGNDTCM